MQAISRRRLRSSPASGLLQSADDAAGKRVECSGTRERFVGTETRKAHAFRSSGSKRLPLRAAPFSLLAPRMKLSSSIIVIALMANASSSLFAAESTPARATSVAAASPSEHRVALTPGLRRAAAETRTFGRVDKFQPPSGSAASVHIGRTPSLTRKGTAKLNRFVFRRTAPSSTTAPRNVVRASGESRASR